MDVTPLEPMPDDWDRALCVVAHPDDMEYGASGAVARWTSEGKEVAYLLVTRGEAGIDGIAPKDAAPLREEEQRASCAAVGVGAVEFLDHQDGVIEEGVALRRDIAAAIRRHRPEVVVIINHTDSWGGGSWNSSDHRAVGRSTLDAVADAGNRWIFRDVGEPWGGIRWVAIAGSPSPTHAVALTPEHLSKAADALACHAAYLAALDPETPIEEQARGWIERVSGMGSDRFGDRPCCAFELQPR